MSAKKSKNWWQSKTVWATIFVLLAYILGKLAGWDAVDEVLVPAWGLLALILRAATDSKIDLGKPQDITTIRPKHP